MAILSKLILGSAILSSVALAAPFRGKAAWTVTETDYTTIDVTTTIYIDDSKTTSGGLQPTSVPHSIPASATESSSSSVVPTLAASTSVAVIPTASPASFYTPPATTLATTSAAVVTSSSTLAAVVTSSSTSSATVPTSSALVSNGGTGAPSSASDSASCQGEGAACEGDITYYDGGLGACGVNVDPTGNGVALPFEFMGTASNSNPYCGKTLTIYNPANGKTTQATVMDKCMGCTGRSIDLTPTLFTDLTGDLGLGRVQNVDWWFN